LRFVANILRFGAFALGVTLATIVAVWLGARFADGPIAVFPGGPFTSGVHTEYGDVDWARLGHLRELEFQLVTPPKSRTAWFTVHKGIPYIHCAFCTNRTLKKWPRELERDNRIIVRIGGMRIPGRAVRVPDPSEELLAVRRASRDKYSGPSGLRAAAESGAASVVVGVAESVPGAEAEGEPDSWRFRVETRLPIGGAGNPDHS
jgi:hypothetical protein